MLRHCSTHACMHAKQYAHVNLGTIQGGETQSVDVRALGTVYTFADQGKTNSCFHC